MAAAVVLAALVFVDQGGTDTPAYAGVHAQYVSDSAFFATVRSHLGAEIHLKRELSGRALPQRQRDDLFSVGAEHARRVLAA